MRRTERLFAMTEYLRGRRTGVTAEELARRFRVTVRTVYRDLDSLRDAALPLRADRGRGGGYALDSTYSLPPVNFTAREAATLLVAGAYLTDMRLIPFSTTLQSGLDKVRAALSRTAQRELAELLKTIRFTGVPARSSSAEVRAVVEQAWFEARPLRIRYQSANGEVTDRNVRISSVVLERSETLLNCIESDGNPRQFRLHQIQRAELVDGDAVTPPPSGTPRAGWLRSRAS
ncbi:MAG: HTH domain-containing protein [Myxococcota bacterium]